MPFWEDNCGAMKKHKCCNYKVQQITTMMQLEVTKTDSLLALFPTAEKMTWPIST